MSNKETDSNLDPYRSLDKNLDFADVLNKVMLLLPRRRIVQILKGQRVLDVCCGTGNLTAMLTAAGSDVVGVDSSATMLSHALRKHIKADFVQMNATQLPFRSEFDAAVVSIALHEMRPEVREGVWHSMRRAVRPEGRLIALDYSIPEPIGAWGRLARGFTERDERAFLNIFPEHYENFQGFMRDGGLRTWIRERGERVESEYAFWGGTVALVVVRRSSSD